MSTIRLGRAKFLALDWIGYIVDFLKQMASKKQEMVIENGGFSGRVTFWISSSVSGKLQFLPPRAIKLKEIQIVIPKGQGELLLVMMNRASETGILSLPATISEQSHAS